jgi:hypothetical protein
MYRRRRRSREIPFSFDSFLDVVANVCGIIIRLILVAWVGARAYHTVAAQKVVVPQPPAEVAVTGSGPVLPPLSDPLEQQLLYQRAELEQHEQALLEQLRQYGLLQAGNTSTANDVAALTASQTALAQEGSRVAKEAAKPAAVGQTGQPSPAELKKRSDLLAAELRELQKQPPPSKILHYRTPVSRPVHSEELHFECNGGKVTFIDLQSFLAELKHDLEGRGDLLKTQWEVDGTTGVSGAFRLRYTIERERGALDGAAPVAGAGFRYGLSRWVVEPMQPVRGETAETALAAGSQFRRLADALDTEQTVVTFWVYPDSFALYRQLRDFLHERNVEVAGRPLPVGTPIASSRNGSASRGQ